MNTINFIFLACFGYWLGTITYFITHWKSWCTILVVRFILCDCVMQNVKVKVKAQQTFLLYNLKNSVYQLLHQQNLLHICFLKKYEPDLRQSCQHLHLAIREISTIRKIFRITFNMIGKVSIIREIFKFVHRNRERLLSESGVGKVTLTCLNPHLIFTFNKTFKKWPTRSREFENMYMGVAIFK